MFFMFGSFDILMGIFVWLFVPETKGLSLEKMDELFGVTETVKRLDSARPACVGEEETHAGKI